MRKLDHVLNRYANAYAERSATYHTTTLKNNALAAGWPEDMVKHLKVVSENGAFSVRYPEEHNQSMLTLEYGTDVIPPSPVIRNFLQRSKDGTL
jgi:hypothetical protein